MTEGHSRSIVQVLRNRSFAPGTAEAAVPT